MPTTKKRVNLSIPDTIYDKLQAYKEKNGITSDASACVQLITRQLDSLEQGEKMLRLVSRFTPEELQHISNLGLSELSKLSKALEEQDDQ